MLTKPFPVIDMVATGQNIKRLRKERGMTVRDLQRYFGFEEPQAIYKWQRGMSLPSVDNLYALGALLEVPMEKILIPANAQLHMISGQQEETCCSDHFWRSARRVQCGSSAFHPLYHIREGIACH